MASFLQKATPESIKARIQANEKEMALLQPDARKVYMDENADLSKYIGQSYTAPTSPTTTASAIKTSGFTNPETGNFLAPPTWMNQSTINNNVDANLKDANNPYMASLTKPTKQASPLSSASQSDLANLNNPNFNRTTLTTPTTQPTLNIQSEMEKLKQAQLSASMSALEKQKSGALSNLTAEQSTIQPQFYNQRNAVEAKNQMAKMNLAEELASRGATNSGTNDLNTIRSNMALQSNIGNLRQQEAQANTDIARRTTDVNNNYLTDVEGARAGIESQALQNMINQMNADRTFDYGVTRDNRQDFVTDRNYDYGVTRDNRQDFVTDRGFNYGVNQDTINRQDNLNNLTYQQQQDALNRQDKLNAVDYAKQQDALQNNRLLEQDKINALNQQKQDYLNTVNRFSGDFDAEKQRVANDGDASNDWQIPILDSQRATKLANIAKSEFANNPNNPDNIKANLEIDKMIAEINKINNSNESDQMKALKIAEQEAKINEIYARTNKTNNGTTKETKPLTSYEDILDEASKMKSDVGGPDGVGRFSMEDVRNYILNSPLSDEEVALIMGQLGM